MSPEWVARQLAAGGAGGGKRVPKVRLKLRYPFGIYPSKRVLDKFGDGSMLPKAP